MDSGDTEAALPLIGALPHDWRSAPFGSLLNGKTQNGIYKPRKFHGRGCKIVNMGELFANPRLRAVPMKRVELTAGELDRFSLAPGDLLFARRSLVAEGAGRCSVVLEADPDTVFESSIVRARIAREQAYFLYLYYVFCSGYGKYIMGTITRDAVVSGITGADLVKLPVPIPPLPEQHRIARLLGAIDDKREVNRAMNRALEDMAQAMFQSRFIDFDGRADLVDSALGPIPAGWRVDRVSRLIAFNPRIPLQRGQTAKYVEMKSLSTTDSTIGNVSSRAFKGAGARFQCGDVLIARITPCLENGKTGIVDFLDGSEVAFGSTEFIVMRGRGLVSSEFAYCLARCDAFRRHAISNMTGSSGRQRVSIDALEQFRMPCPDDGALREFARVAAPIFQRISANRRESHALAALRDTLLPRLISGQVRIGDAEQAVDRAL